MTAQLQAAPSGAPCGKMGTMLSPSPSRGAADSNLPANKLAQAKLQSYKYESIMRPPHDRPFRVNIFHHSMLFLPLQHN